MHFAKKDLVKLIIVVFLYIKSIKGNYFPNYAENQEACDDFYKYACSRYGEENPDGNYSEITQKLDYEMNRKLLISLKYLAQNITFEREKQSYRDKMLTYWEACRREKSEVKNIRKYLQEIKPGKDLEWPLMDSKGKWERFKDSWSIWPLLGELQSLGLNNILLKTDINRNEDNTLNIWLAPASRTQNDFPIEKEIIKIILKSFDLKEQAVEEFIKQYRLIESKWQQIILEYGYKHQLRQMNLKRLIKLYPQLNFRKYFEKLLGSRELKNIALITVEDPRYFDFLNRNRISKQDLKHLSNYIMIRFLYFLVQDSTEEFSSWSCLKDLKNKFDLSLNYLYYQDYFNFEPRTFRLYFHNLFYKIRATILKFFELNHLNLSKEEILFLKTKLFAIKTNIGNLPQNVSAQVIADYYQDLNPQLQDNYFKNHLSLLKHRFRKSLLYQKNQTHFIVTSNQWGSNSSPFYISHLNMIVFPFASFQLPFFQYLKSPLEQVPIFGFVLAHELAHAFDSCGLHYDHQGYSLAVPSDILQHKNFSIALNCLQQQHPTADIDERIADLFAARVAYQSYVDFYAAGHKGWERQFFVNMAQFFCGKNDVRFIGHDADPVRLHQIVRNFLPFSQAFGCTKGTRMYKRNKCRLY